MGDFTLVPPMFPPMFYDNAYNVNAFHDNTPGMPLQFHYQEIDNHPTYASKENIAVNLSPYSEVPQNGWKEPITGHYQAMVYDVPFSKLHDEQTNNNLVMYGLGFAALAFMLV